MHFRKYYDLTKPGIIYANVLTATAGYLYGSKWHIDYAAFLGVIIGTSLVIAGACVYNNLMDRNIDKVMKRTRQRALVTGEVAGPVAASYATLLTLVGFGLLAMMTNLTVVIIGLIGFVDYVLVYGWAKRHTPFSTLIGSVSGAASVAAGCAAATNRFGGAEAMLFMLLVIWQMPHFYGIALYRGSDYKAAALPVMPVIRSAATAKLRTMLYIVAFLVTSVLFTFWGYGGVISLFILGALTLRWLYIGLINYHRLTAVDWGKKIFLFSLVVNLGLSLTIAISSVTI